MSEVGYISAITLTEMANAIREKNGSTETYRPSDMPAAIRNLGTGGIDTSDATATAADILSGKTAYVDGEIVTGNIQSKGAQTYNPSTTNQTIASGQYLSGEQTIAAVTAANLPAELKEAKTVTAPLTGSTAVVPSTNKVLTGVTVSAPNMSDATATSDDIVSGKTAYVNGVKVAGTLKVVGYIFGSEAPLDSEGEDDDIYLMMESHGVAYNLANASVSNHVIMVGDGKPYETVITVADGYVLNNVIVMMRGVNVTNDYFDANTMTISIPDVTGNISITVNCVNPSSLDNIVGNVSATGNGTISLNSSLASGEYTLYFEDENNEKLANWDPIAKIKQS